MRAPLTGPGIRKAAGSAAVLLNEAGRKLAPMRSVPAMARAGSERGIGAVHLQSHQRIPAPRLIAVIASSAIAVVKRVSFAFT
jgi:hypothetical protein